MIKLGPIVTTMLLAGIGLGSEADAADARAVGLKGNPGQFFGADDHPVEALRAGEQGRVVAKLWIDRTGKVASCTVAVSSGSASLDQATCKIALEKVTFSPAADRRGRPIAAAYTLPVRWVLPTDKTVAPENGKVEMTVSLSDTGEVLACNHAATPTLPKQMDPCAEFPVGKISTIRWRRDDRPVGGTLTRTYIQQVTLDP